MFIFRLFVITQKSPNVSSNPYCSVFICVFAILLTFFSSLSHPSTIEIQQLAVEAKERFSSVMYPPISQNILVIHGFLEPTSPFRDYVVKSFNEAVDALVVEASNQERQTVVTSALRELIKDGETDAIDHVFAEMLARALAENKTPNPQAAAILRHSVALVELPIALQPTTFPTKKYPVELSPFVLIGIDLNGIYAISKSGKKPVPGPKTLPAYLEAVKLDPADFWSWIVIATLSPSQQGFELALAEAEKIALANNDRHELVLVKMELARLEDKAHQPQKASQPYRDAVSIALGALAENPADDTWKYDSASALMGLGNLLKQSQPGSKEHDEAIEVLEKAVELLGQLVANHPDNPNMTLKLAIAHSRLANAHYLPGKPRNAENQKQNAEADRLFNSLIASDRLKPTVKSNPGMILTGLTWAGGLTLFIGAILIFMYRRRVSRWMLEASSAKIENESGSSQIVDQSRRIEFAWITAQPRSNFSSFTSAQMESACRHHLWATWIYVTAGIVFALIAAYLLLTLGKVEITFIRLIAVTLIYAWPIVLTLWLLWGPDRIKLSIQLSVFFGLLLALSLRQTFLDTPPFNVWGYSVPGFFQPIYLWFDSALTSLFLLLFLNRHIRAVGPVVLVLMLTLVAGAFLLMILASTPVGIGPLASLSVWLENLTGSPVNSLWLAWVLGALLIAPAGWLLIRELCSRHEKKNYSQMTLVVDSIWLFQMYCLCSDLSFEEGSGYWLGISSFIAYKFITSLGLRPLSREALQTAPARLLLLRVFGYTRRSERLLKLLEARWRYAGPIQLIAAPDLAASTADPGDFLRFITGKLKQRFIIEPIDIDRNLAQMDYLPDPDGRYRINEVFCGNDAWRPVVQYLMIGNDLVVMDLRSFSAKNKGCEFELQALVDYVPFDRMVLLVNKETDTTLLRQTLTSRWQTNSTPANARGNGIIHVLNVGRWDETAIDALLAFADARLSSTEKAPSTQQLKYGEREKAYVETAPEQKRPISPKIETAVDNKPLSRRLTVVGSDLPAKAHRTKARLFCIAGPLLNRRFSIEKEAFFIGANAQNDLCILNDEYVSGNHTYLRYDNGKLFIIDQGSRNGTFVNGQRIYDAAWLLNPGDQIQIGSTIFELSEGI